MLSHFSHVPLFATIWTVAAGLLCPWDSAGKNTGVGCYALLQGVFLVSIPTGIKPVSHASPALQADTLPSEPPGNITLPTKVCLVKAMVFPVVMYGCENWTVKKAEHRRIDAFELWCWRRLSRVQWTARSSNQSILKEISPGCSLEGMMLKLKLQCFGYFM